MNTLKSALIATSVGALLAVLGTSSAIADPIDFTWNPSLSSGALSTAGAFTADRITTSDYSTITLGAYDSLTHTYNNVMEQAILPITQFSLSGSPLILPGLNGQSGATKYQLYFVVNATSAITVNSPTNLTGEFTSLSYTLMGYSGGNCSYSATTVTSAATCSGGTSLALSTGSLTGDGINSVSIISGQPAAAADASIVAAANTGGFFVSPANLALIEFESAFTNSAGAFTDYCGALRCSTSNPDKVISEVVINGGGGDIDVTGIPEPFTLSLFGVGIAGAAALRRRRSKKA